jgi:ketosteroid isomerase-like protein
MKLTLAFSVLFLTCLAQAQTAGKSPAADDSDLKNAEQQWVEAYYRGDGKTLSQFEADDFTVIANGQKQTKAQQIAEDIRHYGDVALITGLSGGSNVRFTAVWIKMNGSWKVIHLHYCQGD